MRAAVVTFPGSNCDDDCSWALAKAGFSVEHLWHKKPQALGDYAIVVLPGGFSYGDYLRCGAIAAHSPIVAEVKKYAERGGLVFGICNGFQILCESGLLPGVLVRNESQRFICKDVELKVERRDGAWTNAVPEKNLRIPIAHGDGRYVVDAPTKEALEKNKQVLFRYAGENPNGSVDAIAGVTNVAGNVLGMMPHPERASDLRSHDGTHLWHSVRRWAQERTK